MIDDTWVGIKKEYGRIEACFDAIWESAPLPFKDYERPKNKGNIHTGRWKNNRKSCCVVKLEYREKRKRGVIRQWIALKGKSEHTRSEDVGKLYALFDVTKERILQV